MTTISVREARARFSELLERVARGERIVITRRNVPVALLQPVSAEEHLSPQEVIAQLKAFRRRYRLRGLDVREMRELGRA